MKHYVCIGTCNGESNVPKSCEAENCTREGMPLNPCLCADGAHDQVQPEEGVESANNENSEDIQ